VSVLGGGFVGHQDEIWIFLIGRPECAAWIIGRRSNLDVIGGR
jgi:hypothetical protein